MANPFLRRESVERDETGNLAVPKYSALRPLTASAEKINISDKKELDSLKKKREADTWQTQAWAYSELIGEVRFAATLVGNLTSRIRLYPGYITDEDLAPADIQDIEGKGISDELKAASRRAIRLLSSGNGGISGLLRDASVNLFVTGECYLFQKSKKNPRGTFGQETWEIRSVDEIQYKSSGRNQGVYVKGRRTAMEDTWEKQDGNFLGRIWHSYPRYSDEADSSLRPLLELMDELLMWNKAVRSAIKSQMNGGILFIPDDIANIAQSDGDSDDIDVDSPEENVDTIEEDLLAALTAPISDEGAHTSVVPVIFRGPSDMGENIRHITLAKNISGEMQDRADNVLDRILAGIDIPKDVVSGLGSAKYSNAMVIEETMYKSHIEPLALLIVDSLTTVFLHPVLKAYGFSDEEIERVVIWYDPSAIAAKPSKADAADVGYAQKTISAQAWRREHGFSESDAPTQLEMSQRLAMERGLLDEATSAAIFQTLMPDLMQAARDGQLEASPDGQGLQEFLDGGSMVPSPDGPQEPEAPVDTEPAGESYPAPTGLIEP